jgi:beta-N-acetylhexosaminidase
MLPAVFGLSGERLTGRERAFFRAADPAGYILFARNCAAPDQLRALTGELRSLAGRDVAILVDQEGGRVARLRPPQWPAFPAPWRFAQLYARAPMSAIEAARANAAAMGLLLREAGINVDCAPSLDLRHAGGHAIIGDRALGEEPMQVAALGRAVLDGLAAAGVAGVVKHMPGHGRADADSHEERPTVTASADEMEADLAPFRALRNAPAGMAAHIVYTAWDPHRCASMSPVVVADVIRGAIGFDGLLLSDDIAMGALTGGSGGRAADVVAAGCDLALHCSGILAEMEEVAGALGGLAPDSLVRLERALPAAPAEALDTAALEAKRDSLLACLD